MGIVSLNGPREFLVPYRGSRVSVFSSERMLFVSPESDMESVNGIRDTLWAIKAPNGGLDLPVTGFPRCGGELNKMPLDTYPPAPVAF